MAQAFQGIDPNAIGRICSIGAGPIGAGWTAFFLARGYSVTAYVHEPGEESSLRALIDTAWVSLESLGLAQGASLDNLRCTSDLAEAVTDAEFVQESAPEDIQLKQALYEKLGRYYRDYVDVMDHWDEVLPDKVLLVQYEDVVADTETQVRRMLDYCELPFEESCLQFHQTERAVRTASSEQVRQPIYSGALDHWRHYEQHLDELKDSLGPMLDRYPTD